MKKYIDEAKFLTIGDVDQFVLIRGQDINNPLLLILHGGTTETAHFAKFNRDLESEFTVVYWDQRGEGRSKHQGIDLSSLTLQRYLEDIHILTCYLKDRFCQQKIFLLAHSMGTLFGMKVIEKYPKDYIAYIAISQVADPIKSDNFGYDTLLQTAKESNHLKDVQKIDALKRITDKNLSTLDLIKRTNGLIGLSLNYGGLYYQSSFFKLLKLALFPILTFKPYSFYDKVKALKKDRQRIALYYQHNLIDTIFTVEVPIFFIHGREDFIINYALTKAYYEKLEAPYKRFITFEKSAHFPPFEEVERFNNILLEVKQRYVER
ncbi:MAG: alpha/beta hydrolase [Epsilonproteobacteria bacterium]|nr:alpha/beta hydrolase [Campylobacterota bacterium]